MSVQKSLFTILIFGVLLRLGFLYFNTIKHPSFFRSSRETIQSELQPSQLPYVNSFGYEIGNVAYSIVCKHEGFANPFGGSTGPTGWVAPGLVMVYALFFYVFGCFSAGALIGMFALSLVLSCGMILLIYKTVLCYFNNTSAALCGAAIFAVCPQDVFLYLKDYQQDFNIYSFFFILIFFLLSKYIHSPTYANILVLSFATAFAVYFMPVLVFALVAAMAIFALNSKTISAGKRVKHCMLLVFIIIYMIVPYVYYQQQRLGTVFYMKSNAGFELNQGNTTGCSGVLTIPLFRAQHPAANKTEYEAYAAMGEINYVRSRFEQFKENFNSIDFITMTVKRAFAFYFVFVPYVPDVRFNTWIALNYLFYAIPGLSLFIYFFVRSKNQKLHDRIMFGYIAGYSAPYLATGVMYRYSFPVSTITSVLLGAMVYNSFCRWRSFKLNSQ